MSASEGFPAPIVVAGVNYWRTSAVSAWLLARGTDPEAVGAWVSGRDRVRVTCRPGRPPKRAASTPSAAA